MQPDPAPRDFGPHGVVPLGHDEEGRPKYLPAQAAGWRVRRHSGRGRPAIVHNPDGGPLIVGLRATTEDLRSYGCGPGKYHLSACDENGEPIGINVVTEVRPDEDDTEQGRARQEDAGNVRTAMDALARALETMARAQVERDRALAERDKAMAGILSAVVRRPIDSAREWRELIEDRAPAPPVIVAADEPRPDTSSLEALLANVAPLVGVIVQKLMGVPVEQLRLGAAPPSAVVSPTADKPPSDVSPYSPATSSPASVSESVTPPRATLPMSSLPISSPPARAPAPPSMPSAIAHPDIASRVPRPPGDPGLPVEVANALVELTPAEGAKVRAIWATLPESRRALIAGHLRGQSPAQVVTGIRALLSRAFPASPTT